MQDDRIDYIKPVVEPEGSDLAEESTTKRGKRRGSRSGKRLPRKIITGEIFEESRVRSHYPFALYCCLLVIAYIGYVFHYQHLQREEIRVRTELQEERSRSMVFESMRMNASRHSNIMAEVERRGLNLEESTTPPKIINISESSTQREER